MAHKANLKFILFSFEGRISRERFWQILIPWFIFTVFSPLLWVSTENHSIYADSIFLLLVLIILFTSYWIMFATYAKRCHDRGKSGWWVLLIIFLPPIGLLWSLIELGFKKGDPDNNAYGEPPV